VLDWRVATFRKRVRDEDDVAGAVVEAKRSHDPGNSRIRR
jgi:hypothetical protein